MWPLDVHYGILLGSSVRQLFFDPLYSHSAQIYLNEPTFRVTQVVSAIGYNSMEVVRPSPLPEGSNRSRAELDTPAPACHVSEGGILPRNPCVAQVKDVKKFGKIFNQSAPSLAPLGIQSRESNSKKVFPSRKTTNRKSTFSLALLDIRSRLKAFLPEVHLLRLQRSLQGNWWWWYFMPVHKYLKKMQETSFLFGSQSATAK
ncbi:hypothetical protein NPIL_44511 [Nephila pilipes]|uniref:Uncharacterized protein n=1 Tax=Nephila pilipes TaxID=299642 RepID=A0A8X6ING9_NEPPI|nr:hypothetical protein NPIL_44511 [Nephila pilipes]